MIILKEGQKLHVLKSGKQWFTCVSDEKGLICYKENPYIFENEEGTKIDMKSFQSSYDKLKDFDMKKEIKYIKSVDDYSELVDKIMSLQSVFYDMMAFNSFIEESKMPDEYKKGTTLVCEVSQKRLENIEETFQILAQKVPKNWAYAMFPESSWTGYPVLVAKHRVANGNMTRYAETCGKTLSDVKETDNNAHKHNDLLNLDIYKEENRFLELQNKINEKEQALANKNI